MSSKRDLTLAGILPHLTRDSGGWHIVYQGVTLRSAFQPIVSITHKRIVGYEALLRATHAGGQVIAPDQLFARAKATGPALALERLARCVHFANFAEQGAETGWLFVNALPLLLRVGPNHRAFTDELCDYFGIPHHRLVVEIIEQPSSDESSFDRMVETMRQRDLLIAIDDFGTGFSNFDRIWRVRPDIVKLDRSLISRIASPTADHQFATQLVTMLHRAGTMVLGEGVESEDELMTLMEADVDFVQGYWLGRPHASIEAASEEAPARIDSMWRRFRESSVGLPGMPVEFGSVEEAVLGGANAYKATDDLALAAQRTFRSAWARRVFVVDRHGDQGQPSIAAEPQAQSARLAPLFPDSASNWSRRAYFKRAMAAPGRVAVMGPHYSLTDGKDCYTAAVTIERGGELEVFCVDFVASVHVPDRGAE
ncbi:EAL domain-containing protein [Trinickia dinghuensis]|uniref:EAL domain-containing protein n=1 Tax=Trinickia dinghuensis TaxID=2291023 RepID=A0A3D8JWY1_9BURK|nr:EAL domain-containing protein [Trinickia dinghuensis]RDU97165.1 EAL domain-containing protein [Trinickia dinghuensis]